MQATTLYQINGAELQSAVSDMTKSFLLQKYAEVRVSTATVCEIWGITPQTLTRYVREGIIEVVGKSGAFNLFSLADVLSNNPKHKRFQ